MMKRLLLMAALISMLSAGTVFARGGGGGFSLEESRFWLADQDRNYYIDRDEANSKYGYGLAEVYDQVDRNGDGKIYQLEFNDFINGRLGTLKPSNTVEPENLKPEKG